MKATVESGITFPRFLETVEAQRDFWFGVSQRATSPEMAQSSAGESARASWNDPLPADTAA